MAFPLFYGKAFSILRVLNSFANEYIAFDAIPKQTPYRYITDVKDIICNGHREWRRAENSVKPSKGMDFHNDLGQHE